MMTGMITKGELGIFWQRSQTKLAVHQIIFSPDVSIIYLVWVNLLSRRFSPASSWCLGSVFIPHWGPLFMHASF